MELLAQSTQAWTFLLVMLGCSVEGAFSIAALHEFLNDVLNTMVMYESQGLWSICRSQYKPV